MLVSEEWLAVESACRAACDKESGGGFYLLDDRERVLFCVWAANGAIGNGGFHSLCYNQTGDYLPYLPGAYRAIGAPAKAALFERLSVVFGPAGPSEVWEERLEQHEGLSEEQASQIEALDGAYYDGGEDIDELLIAYVKATQR